MPPKERNKENEIQLPTEANLAPRNVARFGHAGRQLEKMKLTTESASQVTSANLEQ
jgi:hypothetical protein